MRVAGPSMFEIVFSFQPIIWSVFGGLGTISGPIVGVYLLYPVMEFLRIIPEFRDLIFALIIIVVILFMPRGLTIRVREEIERECLRCKTINIITRNFCRVCRVSLHGDSRSEHAGAPDTHPVSGDNAKAQ
jgi:branched-chain amino acid transport system permease protein